MYLMSEEGNHTNGSIAINVSDSHQSAIYMNKFTKALSLTSASIVISATALCLLVRNFSVLTLKESVISASIVINDSPSQPLAKNMSEFTLEKNLLSASIVLNALDHHQTAKGMSEFTQTKSPLSLWPQLEVL